MKNSREALLILQVPVTSRFRLVRRLITCRFRRWDVPLKMTRFEDVESHKKSILESAENMTTWTHEWRIHHPDGGAEFSLCFEKAEIKGSDSSMI